LLADRRRDRLVPEVAAHGILAGHCANMNELRGPRNGGWAALRIGAHIAPRMALHMTPHMAPVRRAEKYNPGFRCLYRC
jgi:hypothetical protein